MGLSPTFSRTHSGILTSRRSTKAHASASPPTGTLSYRGRLPQRPPPASADGFSPDHFRRRRTRRVSCYALFQGWLLPSQPPRCLGTPTSFAPLSRHLGTLAEGLGSSPLADEHYRPPTVSRAPPTGIRSLPGVGTPPRGPPPNSALPPAGTTRGTTSIVFGENQLSPGLLGLSPLPTGHRRLLQQPPVRPSTGRYPSFSLPMGRSPRLRVGRTRLHAPSTRFRFGSAACPPLNLAAHDHSPDHNAKGTRSGHPQGAPLPPLVGARFQALFHRPPGLLFTLPSRYWCTIGHGRVFSLGGWSPQLPAGFHVPHRTQAPKPSRNHRLRLQDSHLLRCGLPADFDSPALQDGLRPAWALQPRRALGPHGLGSSPFARHY